MTDGETRSAAATPSSEAERPPPDPDEPPADGERDRLTTLQGLAALSLDALSSVAYGPEAIVLVLVAAGAGALRLTLPVTAGIVVLLAVLVVSYAQVIAVHPDGGGAYAVARAQLGETVSSLAAASLVVDYVLTVAVSLAAGAGALTSTFPILRGHQLLLCLAGLAVLTAVNLRGIAETARALMAPTLLFVAAIGLVVLAGLLRSRPAAAIGDPVPLAPGEAIGVLLVLKAFSAGCSALTGVEAIANAVPTFRRPRVRNAQRTELLLGALLGVMLLGLAVLIARFQIAPHEHVTVLAQLTAAALGTGPAFTFVGVASTLVLLLAANTSYGGLPVLLSLLARDHRMPHLFGLRAERQVYRYGILALTLSAGPLLWLVDAETQRLVPLFAIGVFIGFTISQTGLVRHWYRQRPPRWSRRAALNGFGALLTAGATVVFLLSKFTEGAWVVVAIIPVLMLLFTRVHAYYTLVGQALELGRTPAPPQVRPARMIVLVGGVSRLTRDALGAALSLSDEVVAVSVQYEEEPADRLRQDWQRWNPGVGLDILLSSDRHLIAPILDYVSRAVSENDKTVAVLIPEVEPRRQRHELLQNQRGLLLAAALRSRSDAVVCTFAFRLPD